jgi:hypothetical protein
MGRQDQKRAARPFFVDRITCIKQQTMLNINMTYYFIYKTVHKNGKYYIGRHSTDNLDDGYIGSGRWPRSIKDKFTLTRTILEFANNEEQLIDLERKHLLEHYGKPNCMNQSRDPVGFDSENNPMKRADIAAKISGDNHWLAKNPQRKDEIRDQQKARVKEKTHNFLGAKNPNKNGRNAKTAMQRGTHVNIKNNPSIWRSEQGIHHWQHGKSPNAGGKLNRKLIEEGRHNFLGPELNRRRIAQGRHNFVGAAGNLKRLAEGRHPSQMKKTCEHCGKEASVGMYKRWHGDNCKRRSK